MPDTKNGLYRPKLAGWGKKLAYLLQEGWKIEEIKTWSKERWKTEKPRDWPPAGFRSMSAQKSRPTFDLESGT